MYVCTYIYVYCHLLVFLTSIFTMFVLKYFPDDNDAVVVAVVVVIVVVVILGWCIVMDILFCYCCKRKERHDQDNGMYVHVHDACIMYICVYVCMYLCTYTVMCLCTHMFMYVCMCICMYVWYVSVVHKNTTSQ